MGDQDAKNPETEEIDDNEQQDVGNDIKDNTLSGFETDVREIDVDSLEEVEIEILSGAEPPPKKSKVTKQEVLSRLAEKNKMIMKLAVDNKKLESELKELNDKWLRGAAEFENFRKRSNKERELLKQQTQTGVILEFLSVLDDFERAFSVVEEDESNEFLQGIKLIHNNLQSNLGKLGVSEIEAQNTTFDPNFHMAVGQIESEDVESGQVCEVVQKGYRLDRTVIRPASVIVAK